MSDLPVDAPPFPVAGALLIDRKELARRLSISLSTLHSMQRAGKLPLKVIRMNAAPRFDAREVSAWVAAGAPAAGRWRMLQQADAVRKTG
jgi:predicted DNA-binding transcriptional regulator AlpA